VPYDILDDEYLVNSIEDVDISSNSLEREIIVAGDGGQQQHQQRRQSTSPSNDDKSDSNNPRKLSFTPAKRISFSKSTTRRSAFTRGLTPLSPGIVPILFKPSECPKPLSLFNPWFHMEFLTFKFTTINDDPEHAQSNLKEIMDSQLTQTAVVAALICSMMTALLFELNASIGDNSNIFVEISKGFCVFSIFLFVMSVFHAIFHMIIMSEFNSFDELVWWVNHSRWKTTIPMRLFMGGTWCSLMSYSLYIIGTNLPYYGPCLIGGGILVYAFFHALLAEMLQSFYMAKYHVSRGWRAPNPEVFENEEDAAENQTLGPE
jgi:hypothetical protein